MLSARLCCCSSLVSVVRQRAFSSPSTFEQYSAGSDENMYNSHDAAESCRKTADVARCSVHTSETRATLWAWLTHRRLNGGIDNARKLNDCRVPLISASAWLREINFLPRGSFAVSMPVGGAPTSLSDAAQHGFLERNPCRHNRLSRKHGEQSILRKPLINARTDSRNAYLPQRRSFSPAPNASFKTRYQCTHLENFKIFNQCDTRSKNVSDMACRWCLSRGA